VPITSVNGIDIAYELEGDGDDTIVLVNLDYRDVIGD
jgi:hypothetical protein